jgi:hypothetical protein
MFGFCHKKEYRLKVFENSVEGGDYEYQKINK